MWPMSHAPSSVARREWAYAVCRLADGPVVVYDIAGRGPVRDAPRGTTPARASAADVLCADGVRRRRIGAVHAGAVHARSVARAAASRPSAPDAQRCCIVDRSDVPAVCANRCAARRNSRRHVRDADNGWAGLGSALALHRRGDIELRIHATGSTLRGHTVTGTIRGTGIDVGLNSVIRDVRVTLAAGTGSVQPPSTAKPSLQYPRSLAAGPQELSGSATAAEPRARAR